jgi:hypothetical protein
MISTVLIGRANVDKRFDRINIYELIFMLFALAFALGEYAASKEHGWESTLSICPLPLTCP